MLKQEWTIQDAGCLVSGHHGWHAHAHVIDLAIVSGFVINGTEALLLERYRINHGDEVATAAVIDQGGLLDRAVDWMNETKAPANYQFGWFEGEFFLAHENWWGEPEVGYDRDHDGDPVAVDIHGSKV